MEASQPIVRPPEYGREAQWRPFLPQLYGGLAVAKVSLSEGHLWLTIRPYANVNKCRAHGRDKAGYLWQTCREAWLGDAASEARDPISQLLPIQEDWLRLGLAYCKQRPERFGVRYKNIRTQHLIEQGKVASHMMHWLCLRGTEPHSFSLCARCLSMSRFMVGPEPLFSTDEFVSWLAAIRLMPSEERKALWRALGRAKFGAAVATDGNAALRLELLLWAFQQHAKKQATPPEYGAMLKRAKETVLPRSLHPDVALYLNYL